MGLDEVDRREQPAEDEGEDLDHLDADALVDLDDEEDLEDEGGENEEENDESEVSESPVAAVDDEDSEQESLDELLDQRLAPRLGPEGVDDDDDVITLASVPMSTDVGVAGKTSPIKDRQEFVCNRCRLVKAKVQLADTARGLCRDCV